MNKNERIVIIDSRIQLNLNQFSELSGTVKNMLNPKFDHRFETKKHYKLIGKHGAYKCFLNSLRNIFLYEVSLVKNYE